MADYQLGIIGGGNMAEAILRGVLGRSVMNHSAIVVSEPVLKRRQYLTRQMQVSTSANNAAAARCPYVLLAVKPQVMGEVVDNIAAVVDGEAVVISIAAGISTAFLDERLGGKGRLVRAMPNTPMLVGAGMTAIAAGPRATADDLHWAENLFAACGKVVRVREKMMDAVTAVSGSGPAYFFYLIEAMIEAGVAEGLDPETAATLAAETCAGAARLLSETGEKPEVLRVRLTSPGGSTQRAVEVMEAGGVKRKLIEAILAAAERSGELGRQGGSR